MDVTTAANLVDLPHYLTSPDNVVNPALNQQLATELISDFQPTESDFWNDGLISSFATDLSAAELAATSLFPITPVVNSDPCVGADDFDRSVDHNLTLNQKSDDDNLLTSGLQDSAISNRILFVDPRVADYESFADRSQTTEVIVLDPTQDGIQQITETLAARHNVSSVHIVSHGDFANLQLGSSQLNLSSLDEYADDLQAWGQALTANADILFYGCNVASGSAGSALVQCLSHLTGADIAASDDLTGNAELGGDWDLEVNTGTIEASLAFDSEWLQTYESVLATSFNFANFASTAGLTLNGNAVQGAGTVLRLTPDRASQKGSAFYSNAIALTADTSFSTQFQFQLAGTQGTAGADGFTFILQNSAAGAGAIGSTPGGSALGYGGMGQSIAIEFDTRKGTYDATSSTMNHLSLLRNGDIANPLFTANTALDLNSGGVFNGWVDYNGTSNRLDVYLANSTTKPTAALFSQTIDLPATIGSTAFVGFSAASGGSFNSHDVLNWQFSSTEPTSGGNSGTFGLGQQSYTVNEGSGTASITVVRTGGSSGVASIDYTTTDNSATAGADYTTRAGTLTFQSGETSKTIAVPILEDTLVEGEETFNLSLDNAVGASLGVPRTTTIIVTDNETSTPPPTGSGLVLNYTNFSNSADLLLNGNAAVASGALRLTPAQASQRGSVFYKNPVVLSADTSFQTKFKFQLSGGQGSSGADGFTFVLQNSTAGGTALGAVGGGLGYADIGNSIAIEFDTANNGGREINENHISILQNGSLVTPLATGAASLDLNSGTALTAWIEYDGTTNRLNVFLANTDTKPTAALVSTTVDLAATVGSSGFVGFTGGTGGRFNNQDILSWQFSSTGEASTVGLSQALYVIGEENGRAMITVNRVANSSSGAASVNYTVNPSSATAGSDYTAVSGTLTFAAGETTKTITVPIINDTAVEKNETVTLRLSNPVGIDLGRDTATLRIIDNDAGSFTKETVIDGLSQPTSFAWDSLGRMFVAQKDGIVRLYANGVLQPTPFIDISRQVNNVKDRGLLGIAVHPDFANNPYVYLLFTYDPPEVYTNTLGGLAGPDQSGNRPSRLIRVTADARTNFTTVVAGSEVVILGKNSTWANISRPDLDSSGDITIPSSGGPNGTLQDYLITDSQTHSIGYLKFGSDGALYVSNGDGASFGRVDPRGIRTLNPDSLSGKILRIDPMTGRGLSSNPYYNGDPDSNRSKVYVSGLRNPFRFAIHPTNNQLYITDVGWNTWEEVNIARGGENYGWPYYEGGSGVNLQTGGYSSLPEAQAYYASGQTVTPAVFAVTHPNAIAYAAGDFYTGTTLPAAYRNEFLFADIGIGDIYVLYSDEAGYSIKKFATQMPFTTQILTGPDSNLYYADLANGQIGRWRAT